MEDRNKLQQRVEIIAQEVDKLKAGGGGSGEGYTKAQADAKFETQAHASETYLTSTDIADMATKTWVGQQGFLTSADEVPDVTSNDNGKVLKATYSEGTGSYSWDNLPSVSEVPTVGSSDDGKVLKATYSGGTGSYAWTTPTVPQTNLQFYETSFLAQTSTGTGWSGQIPLPTPIANSIKTNTTILGYKFYGTWLDISTSGGTITLHDLYGYTSNVVTSRSLVDFNGAMKIDGVIPCINLDEDSMGALCGTIMLMYPDLQNNTYERTDFSTADTIALPYFSDEEIVDTDGAIKIWWAFEPIYGTLPTT